MGCSASRKEVGVYELIVTGAGELSGRYVQLSGKHMYKDKPWWHKDGRFNEDHGRQVWWNKGEWRVGSTSDHWWANKNPAQPPTSGEWPGWHQKNARGGPYPHFAIAVRERIGAGVMSTEDKESPPDQPKFTRSRSGLGWVYTESGTQKRCKHCGQARPRSMFVGKQWKKPRPTCVDCAAKLSAQNEPTRTKPPPSDGAVSVRQQLEYYFSPRNWGQDAFLKSLADEDGSVALEAFFTFPRIAALLCVEIKTARRIRADAGRVIAEKLFLHRRSSRRRSTRRRRRRTTTGACSRRRSARRASWT